MIVFIACISPLWFSLRAVLLAPQLVAFTLTSRLGTRFLPSTERERVKGATSSAGSLRFEKRTDSVPCAELSLSLVAGMTPTELSEALNNLRGYFGLTKLELRTPGLALGGWSQMVAIHALAGAVIYMSMLTYLSVPGEFVTEDLLLHISLLPRLETLVISPTSMTRSPLGREHHGFVSLRSLDIPNGTFLHRFLSYPIRDLETLRVRDLDRNSIKAIARGLPSLRYLYIEGQFFASPEMFVLGACFQLEEIAVSAQHPLGMDDSDLHRFRAMFRNLRSLSITIRGFSRGTEPRHTMHSREGTEAPWEVETNVACHGA